MSSGRHAVASESSTASIGAIDPTLLEESAAATSQDSQDNDTESQPGVESDEDEDDELPAVCCSQSPECFIIANSNARLSSMSLQPSVPLHPHNIVLPVMAPHLHVHLVPPSVERDTSEHIAPARRARLHWES